MNRLATLIAGLLLLVSPALAQVKDSVPRGGQEALFEPLGFLSTTNLFSNAEGVSADGSVIVGFSAALQKSGVYAMEAFRWENGEMVGLGMFTVFNDAFSIARGVSADGSTVVGYSFSEDAFFMGWEAARWTQDGGIEAMGDFLPSDLWSEATAASADGSVVVGRSYMTGQGFRWENGQMETLHVEGVHFGGAWGISPDGSIIVGSAIVDDLHQAAIWIQGQGVIGLGSPPSGSSVAYAVSADGSTVVGSWDTNVSGSHAFRWTETDGMVLLETLGGLHYAAKSVSGDGSAVVGWSMRQDGVQVAFYWTEEGGTRDLKEMLENEYGLDLSGWSLNVASSLSVDGRVIVGSGENPDGNNEAWRVVLPKDVSGEPVPGTLTTALTAPSPNPVRDRATLTLSVERAQHVTVEVFDVMGRRVQVLYEGSLAAGATENLTLDASRLPSGIYVIRALGADFVDARRITVVR